jgi:two-component system, chemotaxis family, protein-glutamate methylesterase/glutaminase
VIAGPARQATRSERASAAAEPPIRLLIVDDSSVARAVLGRMVAQHDEFEVVATAGCVEEAVDALRGVRVDVILLDIEMPGGSGLEGLPKILEEGQGARVLIVSSMAEEGAEVTVRALSLGATDTLPKPGTGAFGGRFSDVLADRVRRMGRAALADEGAPGGLAPIKLREAKDWKPACIAIGASTGGIHAINEMLGGLRWRRLGVPILVTQHLPSLFMPHFARQLEAASGRSASVASTGDVLQADHIHVAPGNAHLCLERRGGDVAVRLDSRPASSGCLPSVDPMLASVGEIYREGAVAVMLSGMGRDGAIGSQRLVAHGGTVLAQDAQSCAVWGMPRAVAEAGLASVVLPPRDLARRIAGRTGENAWK